jgi:hypothetical protein
MQPLILLICMLAKQFQHGALLWNCVCHVLHDS